jgi:O-antigen ligase
MDMDLALVPTPLDAPPATARRPLIFYLVWAFVLTVPVENQLLIPGIGLIGRLFGIAVAAAWVLHALATGRVRKLERFHAAMLALLLWSFVSLLWSSDQTATIQYVLTMAQLFVLAMVVWDVAVTFDRVSALLQAYVLGAFAGVVQVVSVFLRSGVGGFFRSRATVAGFNPNDIALIFALALPMALFLASSRATSKPVRILNYTYVAGACLAIPLTGSRSGVGAGLALLVVGAARAVSQRSVKVLGWGLVAVALVIGVLHSLPTFTLDRLQQGIPLVESGNFSARGAIWAEALHIGWDHPIGGVGAGAFALVDPLYRSCDPSGYSLLQGTKQSCTGAAAHDVFLSEFAELGIVGLLLFGWVLCTVLKAIPGQPGGRSWLWAGCMTVWLVAVLLNPWELNKSAWLLFVLIAASGSLAQSVRGRGPTAERAPARPVPLWT